MEPASATRSRIRAIAWLAILALGGFQSYAQRYAMSPDGVAYLDLSDAVVRGHWAGLVNGYWSPLYPALIGIARVIVRPSPAAEFTTLHLLNFVLFALVLLAFEYLLCAVEKRARRWPHSIFNDPRAVAGAYLLYGALAVTMLSPALPTPDLIVTALVFVAFAAAIGLADGPATKNAIVIGLSLGVGALAKSFLVPWSLVFFAVLAMTLRGRKVLPLGLGVFVWLVIVLPWSIVLSGRLGHATFGDTGRLTYAWYVNNQEAPSLQLMPGGSHLSQLDSIMPGIGVTDDAPGTNPVWLDPVRWGGALRPHWDASAQMATIRTLFFFYLTNLAPLIFFVLFALLLAEPEDRGAAVQRGLRVYVPALAGIAAYGAIVVTTRYIAGFLIAGLLTFGAALRWPQTVTARRALLATGVPLLVLSIDGSVLPMLALMNAVVVALMIAWVMRDRPIWLTGLAMLIVALAVRVVVNPVLPTVVRVGALLLSMGYAMLAQSAARHGLGTRFARVAGFAVVAVIGVLIAGRAFIRLRDDSRALAESHSHGNAAARIVRALAERGVTPGARIALIGSPYEAYWARVGRLRIVSAVPDPVVNRFWTLPVAERDSVFRILAGHGAEYVVAETLPAGAREVGWVPISHSAAVRLLR